MRRCLRCNALIPRGTHCPTHEAEAKRELSDPRWRTASTATLDRDAHQCVVCHAPCPHPRHHPVDHVIPRPHGSLYDLGNLRTLCIADHNRKGGN